MNNRRKRIFDCLQAGDMLGGMTLVCNSTTIIKYNDLSSTYDQISYGFGELSIWSYSTLKAARQGAESFYEEYKSNQ